MKFILSAVVFAFLLACSDAKSDVPVEVENTTETNNESSSMANEVSNAPEKIADSVQIGAEELAVDVAPEPKNLVVNEEKKTEEKIAATSKKELSASGTMKESAKIIVEPEPMPTNVPLKPDHAKWDALLRANVGSSGAVNYSGMKASKADLESYIKYLESFASRDSWSRNEKLAYWINLYNAATVRLIVQNYPVKSITDLSGGKPWDQNVVKVGTSSYSLNYIENKIIRPRFKDGRIHFAVNCAAKSCPPLLNKAWTSDNLQRYLEKQTKSFINGSANTIAADKVEISKIFDWYKVDFKGGDVIAFLNKYSDTPINADAEIVYQEYDWALNK